MKRYYSLFHGGLFGIFLLVSTFTQTMVIYSAQALAGAQQSDGKIVTADMGTVGSATPFIVCRYTTTGALDGSFGPSTNGIVSTVIGDAAMAKSIVVQVSDQKILVTGYASESGVVGYAVARYTTSGLLDADFASSGTFFQSVGDGSAAYASGINSSGAIIIAGSAVISGNPEFGLMQLTSTGSPDESFGSSGVVTTPVEDGGSIQALAIQSDDKIVVAGYAVVSGQQEFAVARYNTDGSLDSAFGSGGIVTTPVGDASSAYAVAIDGSGNIVVAGSADNAFAVARYTSSGALDTTFNASGAMPGTVTTTLGSVAQATSILIESSGTIIAVGNSDITIALVGYNSDGSLDTSFGTDGFISTIINASAQANGAILQSDGKIVAVGVTDSSNVAIVRYNDDGSYDYDWGIQGIVTIPGGNGISQTNILSEEQAAGTNGGTFTSGAWQTRNLNTIIASTSNVALGTNQIIMQPGSYSITVSAPAYGVGNHQIRLQDVTNNITLAMGSSSNSNTTAPSVTLSMLVTKIFVNAVTAFEIQHRCQTTATGTGFGIAGGFGIERYTSVAITQE